MGHAAVITAYKDAPQLIRLQTGLRSLGFKIFVHIDRKANFSAEEMARISSLSDVVRSAYRVGWGDYAHLKAIILLLRDAIAAGGWQHVHIVSGQDHPIAPLERFDELGDRCHLSLIAYDAMAQHVRDRYELYHFPLKFRSRRPVRAINRAIHRLQQLTGYRRKRIGSFSAIYKGVIWNSLTYEACRAMLDDPRHDEFVKALRSVEIPEEFYIQTLLMNSPHSDKVSVGNLRYTDWSFKNGSNPAYLDESDYDRITLSGHLFARKIDSALSCKLLKLLSEQQYGAETLASGATDGT